MFDTHQAQATAGASGASAAEIDALEARLAAAAGLVHAATATLVGITGEALATGAWAQAGIRSPAHWLAWQSGLGLTRCARLVHMAERAGELPVTSAAFRAGSLSEDQVHEIVAHVPAAHDNELATFARNTTVTQLHKVTREYSYTPPPPNDEEPAAPPTPSDMDDANQVSLNNDDDGRLRLRADLDIGPGALVRKALEACRDAEFRARHPDADPDARPTGVTWADALTCMADAALTGLQGDRLLSATLAGDALAS